MVAAVVDNAERDCALVRPSLSLLSGTGDETCLEIFLFLSDDSQYDQSILDIYPNFSAKTSSQSVPLERFVNTIFHLATRIEI